VWHAGCPLNCEDCEVDDDSDSPYCTQCSANHHPIDAVINSENVAGNCYRTFICGITKFQLRGFLMAGLISIFFNLNEKFTRLVGLEGCNLYFWEALDAPKAQLAVASLPDSTGETYNAVPDWIKKLHDHSGLLANLCLCCKLLLAGVILLLANQ